MLRQYSPQRFRVETIRGQSVECGIMPAGTYFRHQGDLCVVEAWHQRKIGAYRKVGGRYQSAYTARGGRLATIRRIRDGRRVVLADQYIID